MGFCTDCVYWLWTPIVTRGITPVAVAVALIPVAALYGLNLKTIVAGHGVLATQPLWLQGVEIFVIGDFLGYWQHRLFHTTRLWPFHAVHHSSSELDWLSSVYAIMLHANLNWDYGPFRYAIASPAFHRWHHTKAEEGLNRNFSGGLPLWDLLFGTFYMPRGCQPVAFGIDDPIPEGFIGQMLAPFRRKNRTPVMPAVIENAA